MIVLEDWNTVVGEGRDEVIGAYGLGIRNDRGVKLVSFRKRKKLVVTNNSFRQEKRRQYTWKKITRFRKISTILDPG